MTVRKLIVPTDFSTTAEKALLFAMNLASRTGAHILHYHVMIPVESPFIGNAGEREEINEKMKLECLDKMEAIADRYRSKDAALQITQVVGSPPLVDSILQFAKEEQAEGIVMGTQGANRIQAALFGSTAARVLQRSSLPVWLIPHEAPSLPVHQLLMAANYMPATRYWLPSLIKLADALSSGLTVVHIVNTDDYSYNEETERENFARFEEECRRMVDQWPVQFRLIESTGTIRALEHLDEKFSFDIMIMIRQKREFWEKLMETSMTRHMAYVSEKPLLVLGDPADTAFQSK